MAEQNFSELFQEALDGILHPPKSVKNDVELTTNISQSIILSSPRKKFCPRGSVDQTLPKCIEEVFMIHDKNAILEDPTKLHTLAEFSQPTSPPNTPSQTPVRSVQPPITPHSARHCRQKSTTPQTPGDSKVTQTPVRGGSNSRSSRQQYTNTTFTSLEVFDDSVSNDGELFKTPRKPDVHQSPRTPKLATSGGAARTPRTPGTPGTPNSLRPVRSPYTIKKLTPIRVLVAASLQRSNEKQNIAPPSAVEFNEIRRRILFGGEETKDRSCSRSPEKTQLGSDSPTSRSPDIVENLESTVNSEKNDSESNKDVLSDPLTDGAPKTVQKPQSTLIFGQKDVMSQNDDFELLSVRRKTGESEETNCDASGVDDLDSEDLIRMNKNMEKDEKSEFDFFSWGSFGSFTENKPDTAVFVPSKTTGDVQLSSLDLESGISHNTPSEHGLSFGNPPEGASSRRSNPALNEMLSRVNAKPVIRRKKRVTTLWSSSSSSDSSHSIPPENDFGCSSSPEGTVSRGSTPDIQEILAKCQADAYFLHNRRVKRLSSSDSSNDDQVHFAEF